MHWLLFLIVRNKISNRLLESDVRKKLKSFVNKALSTSSFKHHKCSASSLS